MSSKRKLYKPAPAAQTPPHASRRSLAQGRLTSTDPRSLLANVSPRTSEATQSPARKDKHTSHVKRSLNYNPAVASQENPSTPSKQVSPTIAQSPAKVQPSASLSLSEPEDETRKPEVEFPQPISFERSVLAVDASHRHASRVDNEVPIKASYIKSPAKVVRHSPKRKATSEVTGSPHHGNAGKISIPVETVPSINVSAILPHKLDESQSSFSPPASEDSSLSTVAGSPVDRRSKAIETVVVQEKGNPRSFVSFLDSGSCTDVSQPSRDAHGIDQSDVRLRQPNFDDTGVSSIAGTTRMDSGVSLSNAEDVRRKKKKKTRVVQSKYMTSAMSRIGDKPANVKRSEHTHSRNIPAARAPLLGKGRQTKDEKTLKVSIKDQTGNESIVTNVKKPLHTSTPADILNHVEERKTSTGQKTDRTGPSSLLAPSHFSSSKEKNRAKTSKDVLPTKDSKSLGPAQVRSYKQASSEGSPLQRDLIHARLCQWRFLHLKQRDTFKKQEKQAQDWFYSMSQLNRQMRERNHELRIQLAKKKKEEEIDRQLELQLKVLRNLDAQTGRLFPDYGKFYEGIDTTRHHISLQDILMPQNEDELLTALKEFENNAEEVAQLLQNNETKILSFSDEMQALAETVQTETDEHERCTELLAAANSLATQEQSLKAEVVERSES